MDNWCLLVEVLDQKDLSLFRECIGEGVMGNETPY